MNIVLKNITCARLNRFSIFILLTYLLVLPISLKANPNTIICGSINGNEKCQSLLLYSFEKYPEFVSYEYEIKENNTFKIHLNIKETTIFSLSFNEILNIDYIFISPGDSIFFTIDLESNEYCINGSSNGVKMNYFIPILRQKSSEWIKNYPNIGENQYEETPDFSIYPLDQRRINQEYWELMDKQNDKLSLLEFIKFKDNMLRFENNFFLKYFDRFDLDTFFVQYNNSKNLNEYFHDIFSYYFFNENQIMLNKLEKLKIDSLIVLCNVLKFPNKKQNYQYSDYVIIRYIDFLVKYSQQINQIEDSLSALERRIQIIEDSLNEEAKEIAFFYLVENFKYHYKENQKDYFKLIEPIHQYMQNSQVNPFYKNKFNEKYKEICNYKEGSIFPDFILPDTNNLMFQLSNLKNKYVLLHFWGTWCGSCMREMPKINQLYDSLNHEKIEFVHILAERTSDLETKKSWLRILRKYNLKGSHVSLGDSNSIFNVFFFPQYVLLGKNNTIKKYYFYLNNDDIQWLKEELKKEHFD